MARWMLALALAGVAPLAQAGVCDARFMHDGGQVQLTGSGNVSLGADLQFDEVRRQNGDNCRARVRGQASFAYAGLPPAKSRLDYLMTVKNGQASFVRYGSTSPAEGEFDLRMLGLFAYDKIQGQGQRLPGASYRLNIGKESPLGGQPSTTIRVGEKTVGARQKIATALGEQSCWPLRYTRNSDPTMATFKGLTLPIPGMNTRVTDWYCPALDMVMKQEIDLSGSKSVVEITQVK
ncbi:hypothetical protein BTL55_04725 [Bordetella trematum]|nr:hypothetical protein BTL55_04725 [Bordetella trematum]